MTVILFTLKEVWSSSRAISHFVQMISWLLSQIAWWLSFIHLIWASDQRQPFTILQEACTLFWNLFCAVLMATSSVYEQVRQSPEADSKLESAAFCLDLSWVDSSPQRLVLSLLLCSSVLPEASTLLLGTSGGVLGGSPSLCGVLCPLLTSASVILAQALLPDWFLGALLGEQCHFVFWGSMRNEMSEFPMGVLIRGMSSMERMGRGGVSVQCAGPLAKAKACKPSDAGAVVAAGTTTLHHMVVASALLV